MQQTILLVDDEEGIRKVLSISLADSGYKVLTAQSGEEALRIFKKTNPAIVLTDIKMPDMDGITLLQKIKQENSDTEVIMFTGHGDMDLAIKSLQYEATDFVTKPINDNILEIALKRAQERISLRQKLREYTENLERLVEEKAQKLLEVERMAAVGQTITGLSHTIKNIAGGLKGGMFVLEQGLERDDKKYLREGWEMVKGNVDKVKNLSLDLLNYGKFTKIHTKMNDPNQPAREAFDLLKPIGEEKGIDFKLVLSPDLEPFFFDAEAIHRCLLNLVTNAIDACLDQKAGRRKKAVVLKTNTVGGWGVEYQVMDNGCGMDEAVENKIFQGFFSTKGTQGTGIGLMTVKTIVDQHQGTVEVDTRLGVGSTFTMRLPDLQREE